VLDSPHPSLNHTPTNSPSRASTARSAFFSSSSPSSPNPNYCLTNLVYNPRRRMNSSCVPCSTIRPRSIARIRSAFRTVLMPPD